MKADDSEISCTVLSHDVMSYGVTVMRATYRVQELWGIYIYIYIHIYIHTYIYIHIASQFLPSHRDSSFFTT